MKYHRRRSIRVHTWTIHRSVYGFLVKTIRFRESSLVYRVEEGTPWEVFRVDTDSWVLAEDLEPGQTIRGQIRGELLVVASITVENETAPTPSSREPIWWASSRLLNVGDEISDEVFAGVVETIDFTSRFVTFTCGSRLPFDYVERNLTHPFGERVAFPHHVQAAQRVIIRPRTEQEEAYYIPRPGWYDLPGIGPYNLTGEDPDTYVTIDPSGITAHDGVRFRSRYVIVQEVPPTPASSTPDVTTSVGANWRTRLVSD